MEEGLRKFADPQKALLKLIAEKRSALTAGRLALSGKASARR